MSVTHYTTDMYSQFAEIGCLSFALITGLSIINRKKVLFRLAVYQVIIWSCFYVASFVIAYYQLRHNMPVDTQWLLNIHLIFETGILLFISRSFFSNQLFRWIPTGLFGIFLMVCLFQEMNIGFRSYFHYADLSACIFLASVYMLGLFTLSWKSGPDQHFLPERLYCIGLLIYFGCSVPYVSLMGYLQNKWPEMNTILYHVISDIAANTRYAITGIAFLLIRRT